MSVKKEPDMRWRKADEEKLKETTAKYNAKVNRKRRELLKKEKRYEASQLPDNSYYRDMRENIQTRKDFKAEIERMELFLNGERKFKIDKTTERMLDSTIADFNKKIDNTRRNIRKKYTASEILKEHEDWLDLPSKERGKKIAGEISKSQGELASLPQKLNKKQLLKTVQTKDTMRELIKDYREFLKDGAEEIVELPNSQHNLKMTKWQKEWTEKKIDYINNQREIERKHWNEADVKYGGKYAGYKRAEVGMDKGDHDIRDMNLYNYSDRYNDIRDKINLIMREMQPGYWDSRTKLTKEAYLAELKKLSDGHPIGEKIYEYVKQLPVRDFKRVLVAEDNLWVKLYNLRFCKEPSAYLNAFQEIWDQWFIYKDENNNEVYHDMYEEFDYYIEHGGKWRNFYK